MCEADIAVNLAFILGVLFSSIVRWRSGGIPRKESAPAVIQDALSATVLAITGGSAADTKNEQQPAPVVRQAPSARLAETRATLRVNGKV